MPNHVLDAGDVEFLAIHTPSLTLIVFSVPRLINKLLQGSAITPLMQVYIRC